MFRPEFLIYYKQYLCSDALTHFIDKGIATNEENKIISATYYLKNTIISNFALELLENNSKIKLDQDNLISECHLRGINTRCATIPKFKPILK